MKGLACAGFLLVAFVLAGFAQTAWFASPLSRRLRAHYARRKQRRLR